MSKPYLSIIIPVISNNRLDSMLGVINADYLLQNAMFDYELLFVMPEGDGVIESMKKFASVIHNAKCIMVKENNIGGLLRSGLGEASGVLRAISFKNDFRFLEHFSDFIPLFKEKEIIIGPKWNLTTSRFIPQFISSLIHSPYQFQIISEESTPILNSNMKSNGWEFFSESHWRFSLANKNIAYVHSVPFVISNKLFDLHLFLDAATIRIHYLCLRAYNLLLFYNRKLRALISR